MPDHKKKLEHIRHKFHENRELFRRKLRIHMPGDSGNFNLLPSTDQLQVLLDDLDGLENDYIDYMRVTGQEFEAKFIVQIDDVRESVRKFIKYIDDFQRRYKFTRIMKRVSICLAIIIGFVACVGLLFKSY